ncbi:MAG TPA: zinc metalloprotease HtpX [Desulfobacteraceae bacterium]|nr:zinc metalloprotease HtpX [Desulfobacteraceae bacterium]
MGNWFKTTLLLAALTALIVWIGNIFGGRQGMIFAFIIAMGMNFFSYWFSDKIVLRMYRAREVTPGQNPELYETVSYISQNAGLPVPRIFIIPEKAPNAFATGRNPEHAVIAVTEGLLSLMNKEEVMGVLSHEMAHIKNRDILIGSIAATMAGAIMILASMARWSAIFGGGSDDDEGGLGAIGLIIMSILAPIAAMLIQMAISRSREYLADSTGSVFIGKPGALADALEKLGAYSKRLPMPAQPNTAHMFIVNPLSRGSLANLFSTHPPLEERIARLRGQRSFSDRGNDNIRNGKKEAEEAWRRLSG